VNQACKARALLSAAATPFPARPPLSSVTTTPGVRHLSLPCAALRAARRDTTTSLHRSRAGGLALRVIPPYPHRFTRTTTMSAPSPPSREGEGAGDEGPWATPLAQAVPAARAVMARVYGVSGAVKPYSEYKGRYLWTDAHGVCNYVSLARETGDARFLDRADALIRDVHDTLGRDRAGKPLGTPDAPLAGGLRIGKVADEGQARGRRAWRKQGCAFGFFFC
jgi:hypothetical protein